jgi:phage FluMu gp28-like protein
MLRTYYYLVVPTSVLQIRIKKMRMRMQIQEKISMWMLIRMRMRIHALLNYGEPSNGIRNF